MGKGREVNHTPGPWVAWDRGIGWEVNGPDGEAINKNLRSTFTKDDALLLAASLDLLEALTQLVCHACGRRYGEAGVASCGYDWCDAARAAIAKAEGR